MTATPQGSSPGFGSRLRQWRQLRGHSQLSLSGLAEVSTRHLSWLESGKSTPSRAMVLRLAERLDVPLRERNAWLVDAGYAPLYAQRALDDPAMSRVRATLERLLQAQEPWPALAVDRHWQLVAHNRLVPLLLQRVAPELATPPVNVLRVSLHPQGLAPWIENLPDWRAYVLGRVRRQAATAGDPALRALLAELTALPPPPGHASWLTQAHDLMSDPRAPAAARKPGNGTHDGDAPAGASVVDDVAVPLALRLPEARLCFLTTLTVFGAPRDVTLSELAMETLLPADEATATLLRAWHAAAGPG